MFDKNNTPIPFANIYIKNISLGTSSDAEGKYFYQFSEQGVYDLVITSMGFETYETKVFIENNKTIVKNIILKQDLKVLNEIIVKGKEKDPAYGIITNAINNREKWNTQIKKSSCDIYIKAQEIITEKEKRRRKRKAEQEKIKEQNQKENIDLIEAQEQKRKKSETDVVSSRNMIEINMERHYKYPNKIKEVRTGYKRYGSTYGLFFKNTIENDFNFYDGIMRLPKLNEIPLVSPLNSISFITYKFELIETTVEEKQLVYKIKMTPRKRGNATFSGHIWIQDSTFHLKKVDLSLRKGGLLIYDDFNIQQTYIFLNDSALVKQRQQFDYVSKNRRNKFKGQTIVQYNNYNLNPTFPKKYFSNEVGITTKEAYKRDSSYWDKIRPEPLTPEEQKFQATKDSLYKLRNSTQYLDSLDSIFNLVDAMNILWEGIYFTNRKKKQFWGFSSLAGLIDPFEVGGLRIGPYLTYFKKFENEQFIRLGGQFNFGVLNLDPKGYLAASYRYDPFHSGVISLYTGRQFDLVVTNDALTNLFVRNNWIENDFIEIDHNREIANGLFLNAGIRYAERRSIEKYNFVSLFDSAFEGGNDVTPFQEYQSFNIDIGLSYTPFQKYMREPNRKVILGSKWPTFSLLYVKGINGLFGSDINFDYLKAEINQSFQFATLGTSSYKLTGGKFLNTEDLRYVDYKIFPRGDKWFFASLMQSMQIQDTSLFVTDSYLKAHFTHHFNGAIINFVPLIKLLRIHTVVGSSALYIKESNYKYVEWFGGIERTFKINRRRLRLGVYAVDAVSNFSSIKPRIKFAVNFYSIRDNSWGY